MALVLSRSDNGGGGEGRSWYELFEYIEEFIWFVSDGKLEICLGVIEKVFRRVRRVNGDSFDWAGVALSLKSISLNTSDIIIRLS
jgi:hypothetical protein